MDLVTSLFSAGPISKSLPKHTKRYFDKKGAGQEPIPLQCLDLESRKATGK